MLKTEHFTSRVRAGPVDLPIDIDIRNAMAIFSNTLFREQDKTWLMAPGSLDLPLVRDKSTFSSVLADGSYS